MRRLPKLDKFNTLWLSAVVILLVVITIVSLIGLTRKAHVVSVELTGSTDHTGVAVNTSRVLVRFNRPMDRQSVVEQLTITPEVEYSTSWSGNSLQIKFRQHLSYSTDYQIVITSAALDSFDDTLGEAFSYEFTTGDPRFLYLERNARQNIPDRIVEYTLSGGDPREVYRADFIHGFAFNQRYLVVVTGPKLSMRQLTLYDMQTQQVIPIALPAANWDINKVVFSPTANQFAFTAQEVEMMNGVAIPQDNSFIIVYDIAAGSIQTFAPEGVLDISYAPDGGALLFRGEGAIYYLLNLQNSEEYIDLGRHFATGGFNRSREQIAFIDYDPINLGVEYPFINIYNKDRESVTLTQGEQFVVDPRFFYNSNTLVFSELYSELEGAKGRFQLVIVGADGARLRTITEPGASLELASASLDDRYLLIEQFSDENLIDYLDMRDFVFQTKPYQGVLRVYDLVEGKFLDVELRGVGGVWY